MRVLWVSGARMADLHGMTTVAEGCCRALRVRCNDVYVIDREASAPGAMRGHIVRILPDIVHIDSEGPCGHAALQAARQLGIVATTMYQVDHAAYAAAKGVSWAVPSIMAEIRAYHNLADCTIVPTEALADSLAQYGIARTAVVPFGVDQDAYTPQRRDPCLRRQWGADEKTPVALYVGRLATEKNLQLLVRTFTEMRQINPRWRLAVVGYGHQWQWLASACPDAMMLGSVQRGEPLARVYASADLLIMPSMTESWGCVVAEALACGTLVLAFDYAAAGVLVRSGGGLLAGFGNDAEFVSLARSVAAETPLLDRRKCAPRNLQLPTWQDTATRLEDVWRALARSAQVSHPMRARRI